MKASRYRVLIPMLTIIVVITLFVSIGVNFAPFLDSSSKIGYVLDIDSWAPSKPFKHLPALTLSTAALIAILTFNREMRRSTSEFFFKQATQGLDEVYKLLCEKNNDRVIWIRAARFLVESRKLGKSIELPEVQRAYLLHEFRIRNELSMALSNYDHFTHSSKPLPPQFFYGIQDWGREQSLDDVAISVWKKMESHSISIDKVAPLPPCSELSKRSVCAIFDFLEYEQDYKDPLEEVKVWNENYYQVFGDRSGASRYIHHRLTTYVDDGKIYKRSQKGKGI